MQQGRDDFIDPSAMLTNLRNYLDLGVHEPPVSGEQKARILDIGRKVFADKEAGLHIVNISKTQAEQVRISLDAAALAGIREVTEFGSEGDRVDGNPPRYTLGRVMVRGTDKDGAPEKTIVPTDYQDDFRESIIAQSKSENWLAARVKEIQVGKAEDIDLFLEKTIVLAKAEGWQMAEKMPPIITPKKDEPAKNKTTAIPVHDLKGFDIFEQGGGQSLPPSLRDGKSIV